MDIYKSGGYLLEIKSHSLFSKWFSESGKLISRLFGRIREMVEDEPDALFVVLIDEVESLAGSRVSSGGAEPSDAVRAVNSLLTSLDSIRQFRNVLVVCTSNITGCVDEAFIDRVDWMVKVDLPCLEARYEILRGCLVELERAGILNCMNGDADSDEDGLSDGKIQNFEQVTINGKQSGAGDPSCSQKLLECATLAKGLSGRALRKLPFQSHAFHVNCTQCDTVSVVHFLAALKSGIERKIKGDV
jgi:SpoVK/Ycf46/Vps4 family AAA+-type ATPase